MEPESDVLSLKTSTTMEKPVQRVQQAAFDAYGKEGLSYVSLVSDGTSKW